jgi:hypothetical protein
VLHVSPSEAPDALRRWAQQWFALLAAGRLDEACAQLDEPNTYGVRWTPSAIRALVEDTFAPGTHFRTAHPEGPVFTPVLDARGTVRVDVAAFDDGRGYRMDHDVPLNGEVSDLTAQFEFRWRGNALAVILHDLHVL